MLGRGKKEGVGLAMRWRVGAVGDFSKRDEDVGWAAREEGYGLCIRKAGGGSFRLHRRVVLGMVYKTGQLPVYGLIGSIVLDHRFN